MTNNVLVLINLLGTSQGHPIFIINSTTNDISDQATAFDPISKRLISGSISEWKSMSEGDLMHFIPSVWFDEKVKCTPLMTASQQYQERTLTPQYMN
jgi:hypothetical protein